MLLQVCLNCSIQESRNDPLLLTSPRYYFAAVFAEVLLRRGITSPRYYFAAVLLRRGITSPRYYFAAVLLRRGITSPRYYFAAVYSPRYYFAAGPTQNPLDSTGIYHIQ